MWLPCPSWGIAVETILPVNAIESFFANPREKEAHCALKQQERYLGRQGQEHLPKAGQSRQDGAEQALPSPRGRSIFESSAGSPRERDWRDFCISICESDAAVEITVVKLLTGFKAVICKKAISLLQVLGFSILSQSRSKNSLMFIGVYFLLPASLPVLHSTLPLILNLFILHLLFPALLKNPNKPYKTS